MTFDITIQHDLKKLMQSLNTLETKVAPQATVRTLNRVAESAKVASAKHIAPQINSRQAAVKRRIETRKATFKTLWATLVARDRALQLIEFVVGSKKPTQQVGGKRGLVRAKVYGNACSSPWLIWQIRCHGTWKRFGLLKIRRSSLASSASISGNAP